MKKEKKMKELEAKKAELTEKLKTLLAEREALDKGSETYGSSLAKSHEEEGKIRSEMEFIEIILQGIEFAGDFMKNLPSIDQLKVMALSKAEAIAPKIKSALSELFGGIKISEAEKPAKPEIDEKILTLYETVKILLLEGESYLARRFVEDEFKRLKVDDYELEIAHTLDAMKVIIKKGEEKLPLVLFVDLLKKTEK